MSRKFNERGYRTVAISGKDSEEKRQEAFERLAMDESDATIADLITDGCNMGVKSLSRYLNQYQAADEETKDIAKKLIKQEEELSIHMRSFL